MKKCTPAGWGGGGTGCAYIPGYDNLYYSYAPTFNYSILYVDGSTAGDRPPPLPGGLAPPVETGGGGVRVLG